MLMNPYDNMNESSDSTSLAKTIELNSKNESSIDQSQKEKLIDNSQA
jgi:hypothetical protein